MQSCFKVLAKQIPFGFAQGRVSRDKAALRNDKLFNLHRFEGRVVP